MRTRISLFCLFAFLPVLLPAQQTITVTPQSLTGWTITGADPQVLAKQSELTLPAGAQLAQTFNATDVSLQVTTSPLIGENAADWPVLELGTTALVFARNGIAGKLLLVIGDNAPQPLPVSFALDADGRSSEPITIALARQGGVISVTFADQTQQFPAAAASALNTEIVASAAATQSWSFALLEVTPTSVDPVTTPKPAGSGTSQASGSNTTSTSLPNLPTTGKTSGPVTSNLGDRKSTRLNSSH